MQNKKEETDKKKVKAKIENRNASPVCYSDSPDLRPEYQEKKHGKDDQPKDD